MADLVIAGVGLPTASIRGVTQSLQPIEGSQQLVRTVNGSLRDLSAPQFRKYRSTINSNDQAPPALSGVWPGALVTVDWIAELVHAVGGVPEREVVESREEGGWVLYRPRLSMRVQSFNTDRDEWAAAVGWSMVLEEA